jgi:hypothetical protein|nr:MAG TPA: nucelotide kinase [Caudoviricetes sp.]
MSVKAHTTDNNRETVDHPSYYKQGKYEVIDIIENYNLPFHLSNSLKYILRAGVKNEDTYLEDLKKAKWYLDRYINNMEGKK